MRISALADPRTPRSSLLVPQPEKVILVSGSLGFGPLNQGTRLREIHRAFPGLRPQVARRARNDFD